jgi:hypothetical protein
MNIQNNPLTQALTGSLAAAASDGPISEILEFVGITNPEALSGVGGSPGDTFEALYTAFGYDPQFAAIIGSAADVSTGNVAGAASHAAGAGGNDGAEQLVSLLGEIPM